MSAWSSFYREGMGDGAQGPICDLALLAIKREAFYVGMAGYRMDLNRPYYGTGVVAAITAFQERERITADGITGPETAQRLFRLRVRRSQGAQGIPLDLLGKLITLESGNDPGAVGSVDPDDHGLAQINLRYHPNLSLEQAHDPAVAIPYAARMLSDAFVSLHDWDAAVAAYNVGNYGARRWLDAGKPEDGDPLFVRATVYVRLVRGKTY